MKIIAIILIVIGLFLCAVSSGWTHYSIYNITHDMTRSEAAGIGRIISNLSNIWYLSFVNMGGCVLIFFGVVFNIISLFTGRKQATQ